MICFMYKDTGSYANTLTHLSIIHACMCLQVIAMLLQGDQLDVWLMCISVSFCVQGVCMYVFNRSGRMQYIIFLK